MAEGAPLLRAYRLIPIEGSNPSLSARQILVTRLVAKEILEFKEITVSLFLTICVRPGEVTHNQGARVLSDFKEAWNRITEYVALGIPDRIQLK